MKWSRPTALLMFAMLAFQAAAALEVSRYSVCFLLAWILWNMQYCMKVFILCFQRSWTSLEFLKRVWSLAAFLLRFKGTFFYACLHITDIYNFKLLPVTRTHFFSRAWKMWKLRHKIVYICDFQRAITGKLGIRLDGAQWRTKKKQEA